jgi:hypothetical protein
VHFGAYLVHNYQFENLVHLDELKRFGGTPNGSPFASLDSILLA